MLCRFTLPAMILAMAVAVILSACASTSDEDDTAAEATSTPTETTSSPEPTDADGETDDTVSVESDGAEAAATATGTPEPESTREPFWMRSWNNTDFERATVPLTEIDSGGVPADGIPPIDEPVFISFDEAAEWLADNEPVISFGIGDDVRAYPLQILIWHEIVNDEVGCVPVAVTFCPLCNTAIAFDRSFDDLGTLRFGTTGLLRFSDLVMWDDQTESFWQQITGEAIVGELAGRELEMLPASIVSFAQFQEAHPDGTVLSRETGHTRQYGNNPYQGYDDIDSSPFLFRGEHDNRIPLMERVVTVLIDDEAAAYPFSILEEDGVVHDRVGDEEIVVFWQGGATSALDQQMIAESREIGATGVFLPDVDGRELTFEIVDDEIRDVETGSLWNILGQAVDGELNGAQLPEVVHGNHFWFAWATFQPDTRIYGRQR